AARQRGRTLSHKVLQPIDEFVTILQFYDWRCRIPIGDQFQSKLSIQLVSIRANAQKVRGRFDGCEPAARHLDRRRAIETFDSCAHRRFELENLWRGLVTRVDGLFVSN